MPIIIPLIISLLVGTGVVTMSQTSLPGDFLFPVKEFSEDVRISMAGDKEQEAMLRAETAARRTEDARKLLEREGRNVRELETALNGAEEQSEKAAEILAEQVRQGKDVSDTLESVRAILGSNDDFLRTQEDRLKSEEDNLRASAANAALSKDDLMAGSFSNRGRTLSESRELIRKEREQMIENIIKSLDESIAQSRRGSVAGKSGGSGINSGPGSVNSGRSGARSSGGRSSDDNDENSSSKGRGSEVRGGDSSRSAGNSSSRGREFELRGREAEGEAPRGADNINDTNESRGREPELRGRKAEGEAPRGSDSKQSVSGNNSGSVLDDRGGGSNGADDKSSGSHDSFDDRGGGSGRDGGGHDD